MLLKRFYGVTIGSLMYVTGVNAMSNGITIAKKEFVAIDSLSNLRQDVIAGVKSGCCIAGGFATCLMGSLILLSDIKITRKI